jgi:hypothetical protein
VSIQTRQEAMLKKAEEIMEILEAYDLTGSLRGAAELCGCDRNYADFGVMPTWFRKPALRAGIGLVRSA